MLRAMATCQMVSCPTLYSFIHQNRATTKASIYLQLMAAQPLSDSTPVKRFVQENLKAGFMGCDKHTPLRTFYPAILAWGSSNKAGPPRQGTIVNCLFLRAGETGFPPGSGSVQGCWLVVSRWWVYDFSRLYIS